MFPYFMTQITGPGTVCSVIFHVFLYPHQVNIVQVTLTVSIY